MSTREVEIPDDGAGELVFADTVVVASVPHSQAYSPKATASSVLFTGLDARAQQAGGVAALTATVRTAVNGRASGRVRFDMRGDVRLSAGAKAVICVWDGAKRHQKRFTNKDVEWFLSWTRKVRGGEIVQLCLFATTRVTAKSGGGLEGFVELDSIDMVSIAKL